MPTRKQDQAVQQIWKLSKANPKQEIRWLLRVLAIAKQPHLSEAGFVLPTVAMVSLVVVLLTTAIAIRSFDRSKNASNIRVNQALINAATPALDRARVKIDAVLADPALPRETPTDAAVYNTLTSDRYTLGDETRLKLAYDVDGNGTIQANNAGIENNETLTTAWKFPVDTDNNGKFDSYTLYGIYFRSPSRDLNKANNPLTARTSLIEANLLGKQCETAASASLVGESGWSKSGAKLSKSFFIYTATVPITNPPNNDNKYEAYQGNKGFSALEFQQERSRIALSNNAALFQHDLELNPDSEELNPDSEFRLNGRISTNGNLLIGGRNGAEIRLYQISSKNSCFYNEENSKITVGGNVATGSISDDTDQKLVAVDLFNGIGNEPETTTLDNNDRSTTSTGGRKVAYNDAAYNRRIALMKQTALSYHRDYDTNTKIIDPPPTVESVSASSRYPKEVKDGFAAKINAPGGESLNAQDALAEQIEIYLKNRTRRVPYAEVPAADGTDPLNTYNSANVFAPGTIEPPAEWREATEDNTELTLNQANLPQTDPEQQQKDGKETYLGDRIYVGNNLPTYWKDEDGNYVTGLNEQQLVEGNVKWNKSDSELRYRTTQIIPLPDERISDRNGFWENAAAQQPSATSPNVGGLRVITGAGIYVDDDGSDTASGAFYPREENSFLPEPSLEDSDTPEASLENSDKSEPPVFTTRLIPTGDENIVVWHDTMPMTGGELDPDESDTDSTPEKGDLQMRATAVYHYKDSSYQDTDYINRTPTACISSYYDPTNNSTARNPVGLPDVSGGIDTNDDGIIDKLADGSDAGAQPGVGVAKSHNGVVYSTPYTTDSARLAAVNTYRSQLNRQARLVFPDKRIVNQPLREALKKIDAKTVGTREENTTRSLADNAAIDTAICAIKILDGTLTQSSSLVIPHGAIKESTFLDAREIKAIDKPPEPEQNNNNGAIAQPEISLPDYDVNNNYDLELEERQPLEVRVTDIDLEELAEQKFGPLSANNQEYLLPNSGIIYASRDDALPDISNTTHQEPLNPYNFNLDLSNITGESGLLSATDFKLDPTRRPNGIRLIDGSDLARDDNYREEEKGLILATNLPAYIRGDFNLHQQPETTTPTEEFLERLVPNWSNFYTRNSSLDNNFACRKGQPGCGINGDQWRPATIISDAIALLSGSFVDGFREQGDYDLRNNAGSSATQELQERKKNGFFDNSFVTSADWAGNDGFPATRNSSLPAARNSYLTNGVTPIQRRTNFPEYVMEICRKIPVSQCQPSDWVIGHDQNNDGDVEDSDERDVKAADLAIASAPPPPGGSTPSPTPSPSANTTPAKAERLGAGTTARTALEAEDRRYARRVAFKRDATGRLELDEQSNPIPLGINRNGEVDEFSYSDPNKLPRLADNALWFRTTNNTSGKPYCSGNNIPVDSDCTSDDRSYADDQPLYYANKLTSPSTPEIPGVPSLNLPEDNPASGYTVCTKTGGSSKEPLIKNDTKLEGGNCGSGSDSPFAAIEATLNNLLALNPNSDLNDEIVTPDVETESGSQQFAEGKTTTFTQKDRVNVIDLNGVNQIQTSNPSNQTPGAGNTQTPGAGNTQTPGAGNTQTPEIRTTIKLKGDEKSVFVLKKSSGNLNFGAQNCNNCSNRQGIVVELEGVDPNNVFWAINGNIQWNEVNPDNPHEMKGTFITRGTPILKNVKIEGRLLGVNSLPTSNSNNFSAESEIKAIASNEQPILAPVLQIHSPEGSPSGRTLEEGSADIQNQWLQIPEDDTTVNAVFVSGNSPSRPVEESAGLHNFVRFLENWARRTFNINGSFIQYKRSDYATAPFATVLTDKSNNNDGTLSIFGYITQYKTRNGTPDGILPYYNPPTRQWSFDVALLSQAPDLFAQKFTHQPLAASDEFYREVGKDDPWIQTLLCAAQESGTSYTYAVDASDRPTTCPSLTSYNDSQRSVSVSVDGNLP